MTKYVTYFDTKLCMWLSCMNLDEIQARSFKFRLECNPDDYKQVHIGDMKSLATKPAQRSLI